MGTKNFPERTFYWCTCNTWQFSLLGAPKMELAPILDQLQVMFCGESERQIIDEQGHSDQVRLEPGSCEPGTIPAGGITELDRLSYTVACIENKCQIVPVGSYRKNTLGCV